MSADVIFHPEMKEVAECLWAAGFESQRAGLIACAADSLTKRPGCLLVMYSSRKSDLWFAIPGINSCL